jgi:plasmid stability protein
MKTISIHGIDSETEKAIKQRAKTEDKSVNKVVREIIARSLGKGGHQSAADKRAEFADLCGVWTEEEADRFLASIEELEIVDPGDWK